MVSQLTRLVVLLVLCALLAPSSDAQDEGGFEGKPTDFLPLQVGNQWTYIHEYYNSYNDPSYTKRELTIEIIDTHQRRVYESRNHQPGVVHEYFVFSEPDYAWPPVPDLCLAGQPVRFSDDVLVILQGKYGPIMEQREIPLYDFSPPYYDRYSSNSYKTYTTPPYSMLNDANYVISLPLYITRVFWDTRLEHSWRALYPPPLSFGPAFTLSFSIFMPEEFHLSPDRLDGWFGTSYFVTNYGLAVYEVRKLGYDYTLLLGNSLRPVSAVIDGKKIDYPYVNPKTAVQPTSWGQLKARHGQRP